MKFLNPIHAFALVLALLGTLNLQAQTNPYENEIRAFEAEDARSFPAPNSIVFIGSSTINNWNDVATAFPKYNVVNRGFGGSQTSDALFFVDRIATPYRPPLIVFYEGDNDIAAGKTTDQIFKDTTNFFARVQTKSPNTHILYVSIKPSPSRASSMPAMVAANDRIRAFTETNPKLHYVDIYTPMLNANGQPRPELFLADNLHMNQTGYALWTSIIGPVLDEFASAYPIPIAKSQSGSLLIDLGAADAQTGAGAPAAIAWNNVTTIASTSSGTLTNIIAANGAASTVGLQMISRFNGANENGTTASTNFPATATRDSLFGNTETFGGLANITPIFKLNGLAAATSYRLTFYASRTGVGDNRQTRYTATGAASAFAELNAANNINQTALIESLQPDANGAIQIALTPGAANNNANHFTYLGVLKIESLAINGPAYLFDFGAAGSTTPTQTGPAAIAWNNLTPEVGATDNGALPNLIATNGLATPITLQMLSRFNAANTSGSAESAFFPASATQDSLFGNEESFNALTNILPRFKLQNLDAKARYDLTFYASRNGVADNRETRYTVTGQTSAFADLNAANNINTTATLAAQSPSDQSEFEIALAPGPNNNNANHFTYLGVLRLNWSNASTPPIQLAPQPPTETAFRFTITGAPGMIYTLQASTDLANWQDAARFEMTSPTIDAEIPRPETNTFYRLLQ